VAQSLGFATQVMARFDGTLNTAGLRDLGNDIVFDVKEIVIARPPGQGEIGSKFDLPRGESELDFAILRLRCRNHTKPGSSASPLLNLQRQLVALHHAAEPKQEPVTYNQGIPMARMVKYVKDQGLEDLFGE
jgi:hypothetical protein